jgi:hypothetical protein
MLALVVFACLTATPSECRDHRVPLDAAVDPTRCMLMALPFVAKWADEHPGWEVRKFECRPASESDG